MNSPGSASRAPASTAASTIASDTTGLPCALISTTSSPVYEAGAGKYVAIDLIERSRRRRSFAAGQLVTSVTGRVTRLECAWSDGQLLGDRDARLDR